MLEVVVQRLNVMHRGRLDAALRDLGQRVIRHSAASRHHLLRNPFLMQLGHDDLVEIDLTSHDDQQPNRMRLVSSSPKWLACYG